MQQILVNETTRELVKGSFEIDTNPLCINQKEANNLTLNNSQFIPPQLSSHNNSSIQKQNKFPTKSLLKRNFSKVTG